MNYPLRLFFAIEPPETVRTMLTDLITPLQQKPWGKLIRWTHPENLHITLRFIGTCDAERIPNLLQQMNAAVKPIKPFNLQLDAVRLFPAETKPHVLIASIIPTTELFALAQAVEHGVVAAGFTPEHRPYLPHLTLGRLDSQLEIINDLPELTANIAINKIILFNSEKIAKRRTYKPLQEINLKI